MDEPQVAGRRRFDWTINVQTLVTATISGAIGMALAGGSAGVIWFGLVARVSNLEEHDKQQEAHFSQIERALDQQRTDVKEQLRGIGQDVKDTNAKIDDLSRQLYLNAAGSRPETKRWSR
ncbi:hypothetical protein [Burkholderia gladioli]|uniref:hypothetical protein n=1 Tax=Burkholderia gladioli TaxID=28095 RepID=UPI0016407ED5|nr:hypothetical protein [Burkholderia gladioli]